MLRYDRCTPATEQDSACIANWHEDDGTRRVQVTTITDSRLPGFAERRWASFSWKVVDVTTEAMS